MVVTNFLTLIAALTIGANAFAEAAPKNTPVPVDELKLLVFFNGPGVIVDDLEDAQFGQYVTSRPTNGTNGLISIGGTSTAATTWNLRLGNPRIVCPPPERFPEGDLVQIEVLPGMTPFDTARKLNEAVKGLGYEIIPTFLRTGGNVPPADVFRFETIEGRRPPVIRDQNELDVFNRIVAFPPTVEYGHIPGSRYLRPLRYKEESLALGAEFNNFIENGKSALTFEEVRRLFNYAFPGYNGGSDSTFYRAGARVRFWDKKVNRERTGIFVSTTLLNPVNEADRGIVRHAMVVVDPVRNVAQWEGIDPCDIRSVIAESPIEDLVPQ